MNRLKTSMVILIVMAFALHCTKQQNLSSDNRPQESNINAGDVSRLTAGTTVTFAAVIGIRDEHNCVEIFAPGEYEKYHGDAKWAIPSKFVFDAPVVGAGKQVTVTGQMTFVRDSTDLEKTCNIITGNLFEVSDVR